jgi:hypothetical protein
MPERSVIKMALRMNVRSAMLVMAALILQSGLIASTRADVDQAQVLADRMLKRLGGREAWSGLQNTVNGSIQNRVTEPTEVYAVITMDFTQPRFRFDTIAEDVNLIRVINGDASWRISWSGKVEDLPDDRYNDDMKWYQAHIYRTIHRVAAGDPAIRLASPDPDRLEIHTGDQRLAWLKLDAQGEPYAFGFREDEVGSLCGPWSVIKNGIRHPAWVSSHDGTWRAAIKSLEFNVPLYRSTFDRPAQ